MSLRSISTISALAVALAVVSTSTTIAFQTPRPAQAPPMTDGAIEDRIEYRLATNSVVKKYDINVKVDAGKVTLTGTVATEAQKTEAAKVAKIDGVKDVQNAIAVDRDADKTLADRAKNGMNRAGEAITDAWITTKVKWMFVGDDLLEGSDINADTKDRVVTLKGTVRTAAGKTRAVALAKDVDGVTRVVDELTVGR